jgi:hypothetical protein
MVVIVFVVLVVGVAVAAVVVVAAAAAVVVVVLTNDKSILQLFSVAHRTGLSCFSIVPVRSISGKCPLPPSFLSCLVLILVPFYNSVCTHISRIIPQTYSLGSSQTPIPSEHTVCLCSAFFWFRMHVDHTNFE